MRSIRQAGAAALWLSALLTLVGPPAASAALPVAVDGRELPSLAPMLARVTPAVVNIATRGTVRVRENPLMNDPFFRRFFDLPGRVRERETQSLGSGVIVDAKRGYVLTNHHVIEGADEIRVTLRDGQHLKARLVGTDPETDIAVVQVPAKRLTEVVMADSDRLRVGDFVVAIGNPFGLGQTVTSGIVSALGRTGLGIEGYEDFIQTDASINVGNSGGALVNLRGELVGINTAILAPNGGNVGIGFAIPINMAQDIMRQLVQHGRVQRGQLGVVAQDLTPELAEAFGLRATGGAVVVKVFEGSAAATAGLRPGDVITAINGRPVRTSGEVRNAVGLVRVGDRLRLGVLREGRRLSLSAVLDERGARSVAGASLHENLAGAELSEVPPAHPLYGVVQGAVVSAVTRRSPADGLGLRPGDIVTGVNRRAVTGLDELRSLLRGARSVALRIQRGNASLLILVR